MRIFLTIARHNGTSFESRKNPPQIVGNSVGIQRKYYHVCVFLSHFLLYILYQTLFQLYIKQVKPWAVSKKTVNTKTLNKTVISSLSSLCYSMAIFIASFMREILLGEKKEVSYTFS